MKLSKVAGLLPTWLYNEEGLYLGSSCQTPPKSQYDDESNPSGFGCEDRLASSALTFPTPTPCLCITVKAVFKIQAGIRTAPGEKFA